MCEIGLTLSELSWMQRHVRSLAKKPDCTNASLPVCRPQLPFSYPIWDGSDHESVELSALLTLEPLIDAIAAGNTVILKPSAYAPASLAMIKEIIETTFSRQIIFPSLREDVQKIRHCSARSLTRSFLPEARLSERKFCGMPQRI